MIWLETPSNPLLRVTEIPPVVEIAKSIGALTVVDNTFLSPILQRPLEFGADLVMHSSTKYLNGHSDIVGGALVAKKGDKVLFQKIASMNNLLGTSQSPHDCAMIHRGIKTLKVRVLAHQANARGIAKYLRQHRAVARVNYPDIGAMLSFELKNGQQNAVNSVLRGLRFFTLAESLGGVESLVAHPASMTHASMTPEARKAAGISDGLIRLSVGIEDEADLVNDLKRVLDPL
jgi:cystathionine gamma-synthase